MTIPIEAQAHINGINLTWFQWPGQKSPVLLVHATSFHAHCWDQVIAHLPGSNCYMPDMRGHGRSDKPLPPYDWRAFGEDLVGLLKLWDISGVTGVGHSMGGHSVALAAALAPDRFKSLLLIDPVIFPPAYYNLPMPSEPHPASRRRNEWKSPDEMFQRFKDRPPFNTWQPTVLHDYCNYALMPNPNGEGYVLACPPAVEGSIYMNSVRADIYADIAKITVPVRVLRSPRQQTGIADDLSASPTAPDLAAHFSRGEDVRFEGYSHFIPMEAPDIIAGHIREMMTLR